MNITGVTVASASALPALDFAAARGHFISTYIYGTYGYIAPTLHLRSTPGGDLFDTYMLSFDRVWDDESYEYKPQG